MLSAGSFYQVSGKFKTPLTFFKFKICEKDRVRVYSPGFYIGSSFGDILQNMLVQNIKARNERVSFSSDTPKKL